MQPFVGCVVALIAQPPQHAERTWILWDKRGQIVLLVENSEGIGPRMEVEAYMFECAFRNWSPRYRQRWS